MQLKTNRAGVLVNCSTAGEPFKAFVPNPLPPVPALELGAEHFDRLERANRSLGRLDSLSRFLPDVSLFVYWFVRKEAVLSSQIEGTQSSLSDLLLYEQKETPGVPLEDAYKIENEKTDNFLGGSGWRACGRGPRVGSRWIARPRC